MADNILVVMGTRPEGIKLGPIVRKIREHGHETASVCSSTQHTSLLDQAMDSLGLKADHLLSVGDHRGNLHILSANLMAALGSLLAEGRPKLVLVQGDTTTAVCAALAAEYAQIPVAHVEAGLRTLDRAAPWPEEANRQVISKLAAIHFAPTTSNRMNLLREGIDPSSIFVTGNPIIDALQAVTTRLDGSPEIEAEMLGRAVQGTPDRFALVTLHRRENQGAKLHSICIALSELAHEFELPLIIPVHPNPYVRATIQETLSRNKWVHLIEPLNYLSFIALLRRASIVLSDSGGIQEECASLGTPLLIVREKTERPEALQTGHIWIAGTNPADLDACFRRAVPLQPPQAPRKANPCVFGDGQAAQRIAELCLAYLR